MSEQLKTITIVVREDDFDVKCSEGVTLEDIYVISVSLTQQLLTMEDDSSCFYGSSMLQ